MADLKGASVIMPPWWYGRGHFAMFLEEAGITESVGEFYGGLVLTDDIPRSFAELKAGAVDAVFVRSDVYDYLMNISPEFSGSTALACSAEYPVAAILYREDLPREHVLKIGKALAKANTSPYFQKLNVKLTAMGMRYEKASTEDYDPFARHYQEARDRGLFEQVEYQVESGAAETSFGPPEDIFQGKSNGFNEVEEALGRGNFNRALEKLTGLKSELGEDPRLLEIERQAREVSRGAAAARTGECPPNMAYVPGGEITMGGGEPESKAKLDSFCIDIYEYPNIKGVRPRVGAQWSEAGRQCEALGKRLPAEAQWALAARGPGGGAYPWDGAWDPGKANARGAEDGFTALAPSGSFPGGGSPYGAQDMAGNAWEWTAGAADGDFHILRGGSWFNPPAYLTAAARRRGSADDAGNHINGFRCACDAVNAK